MITHDILSVLGSSLSFDIKLPNGQSTRHPNANQFIDSIRDRLIEAILIYERTPLGNNMLFQLKLMPTGFLFIANISGERVEIDSEARRALNYIETGREMNRFWTECTTSLFRYTT